MHLFEGGHLFVGDASSKHYDMCIFPYNLYYLHFKNWSKLYIPDFHKRVQIAGSIFSSQILRFLKDVSAIF